MTQHAAVRMMLAGALIGAAACGGNEAQDGGSSPQAGNGGNAGSDVGGVGGSAGVGGAGVGGVGGSAGIGGVGGSAGIGGVGGSAGIGGVGGGDGSAGTGGTGGVSMGGTGGSAGMAMGGSGGTEGDDHYVRGPEPTADSASALGPFNVESYTSGFRDSPEYADATIWYPTDAEAPFAFLAVVPGFVSPQSSVSNWGNFFASHGMVAITIGTNSGLDQPPQRAAALMDALETLKSEHERQDGPLNGQLDDSRTAIMGWSMGGGGTLIASNENPDLDAAISLAGWNPGATYPSIETPTLLFAATADTLAAGQSQGFYDSIPQSTPKMLFEVQGGDHFMFNDPVNDTYEGEFGRYGLAWMKIHLEGDERYRKFLEMQPSIGTADFRSNL